MEKKHLVGWSNYISLTSLTFCAIASSLERVALSYVLPHLTLISMLGIRLPRSEQFKVK